MMVNSILYHDYNDKEMAAVCAELRNSVLQLAALQDRGAGAGAGAGGARGAAAEAAHGLQEPGERAAGLVLLARPEDQPPRKVAR